MGFAATIATSPGERSKKRRLPAEILALMPFAIGATFFPRAQAIDLIRQAQSTGTPAGGKEGQYTEGGRALVVETPQGEFAIKYVPSREFRGQKTRPAAVVFGPLRDVMQRASGADPFPQLVPTQVIPDTSAVATALGRQPRGGYWVIQPRLQSPYLNDPRTGEFFVDLPEANAALRDLQKSFQQRLPGRDVQIDDVSLSHRFRSGGVGHNVGVYQGKPVLYDLGTILVQPKGTHPYTQEFTPSLEPTHTPTPSSATPSGWERTSEGGLAPLTEALHRTTPPQRGPKRVKTTGGGTGYEGFTEGGALWLRREGQGWRPTSAPHLTKPDVPRVGTFDEALTSIEEISPMHLRARQATQAGMVGGGTLPRKGTGGKRQAHFWGAGPEGFFDQRIVRTVETPFFEQMPGEPGWQRVPHPRASTERPAAGSVQEFLDPRSGKPVLRGSKSALRRFPRARPGGKVPITPGVMKALLGGAKGTAIGMGLALLLGALAEGRE